MARVYSRAGLNPPLDSAGGSRGGADVAAAAGGGGGGTLFDALAAQTVASIQEAEIQDILRRAAAVFSINHPWACAARIRRLPACAAARRLLRFPGRSAAPGPVQGLSPAPPRSPACPLSIREDFSLPLLAGWPAGW